LGWGDIPGSDPPICLAARVDFAAVADIHAMKRRIDQHKGGALADAADPRRVSPDTT
jgi:hypothetical protein